MPPLPDIFGPPRGPHPESLDPRAIQRSSTSIGSKANRQQSSVYSPPPPPGSPHRFASPVQDIVSFLIDYKKGAGIGSPLAQPRALPYTGDTDPRMGVSAAEAMDKISRGVSRMDTGVPASGHLPAPGYPGYTGHTGPPPPAGFCPDPGPVIPPPRSHTTSNDETVISASKKRLTNRLRNTILCLKKTLRCHYRHVAINYQHHVVRPAAAAVVFNDHQTMPDQQKI